MKKILDNHLFLWKICFSTAPGYMIFLIYDAIRLHVMIFLEHTIGIGYVLHCVEYGEPFYKVVIVIGLILLFNMIIIVPDGYFIHSMTLRAKPKIYQALKERMYEKAAEIDLSCYDNPNYYNEFVLAVAEAEKSIDRFLQLLNGIGQCVTIVITAGAFFLVKNKEGILFVILSLVLNIVIGKILNKVNYQVRLQVNPHERKRNYVSRVFYLCDYAKELRLHTGVGDLLKKEYDEANEAIIGEYRKVAGKRIGLTFAQRYLSGNFLLDGLYLAYIIFQVTVLHTLDYSTAVILFNNAGSLRDGMEGFAQIIPMANENSLYIDKIRTFLSYEPEIKYGIGDKVPSGIGAFCLENVSFRYDEQSENVLKDITLKVNKGEKIAIVGYNGAGKTTLIKLLMRLYDPTSGQILYHGKDIRNYDLNHYHQQIGVVFQDFKLYGASLLENVVLDYEKNELEDVKAVTLALHNSGFSRRLESLPEGLSTPITNEFEENGVNLSGGEGQKVAIARAFYRQADILIMDEPSSALDPIAEYNLNASMRAAAQNKTVFYISHRLSTTRDADRIVMLEHGRIVEEGTHDELIQKNGEYAKMWNVQAGMYRSNSEEKGKRYA